jgi:uncharacterized protein (TIGR01777 family)
LDIVKILMTGVTGLIGRALHHRLAAEGHEVVSLSRRPESVGGTAFRWEPEAGPPEERAWEGVEAVVHLAGEPVAASRWTTEQKRRIRESRVTGTRNLVAGMERLAVRPKVLISASAVGYYGDRGDERLTERSAAGTGFLAEVCLDWEAASLRARDLGLRVVLPRIGVVLSPLGGALDKMWLPFKLGLGGRLGGGRQWFPWIHLDDIVGLLHHGLFTPSIAGPINGAAPGIVTNAEFTNAMAAALHRPAIFPVPEFALRIAMGEMASIALASMRIVPEAAEQTGYRFRFPHIREALAEVVKSQGN